MHSGIKTVGGMVQVKEVDSTAAVRFRFRFNRIVAQRLKITKFTANRKKTLE